MMIRKKIWKKYKMWPRLVWKRNQKELKLEIIDLKLEIIELKLEIIDLKLELEKKIPIKKGNKIPSRKRK